MVAWFVRALRLSHSADHRHSAKSGSNPACGTLFIAPQTKPNTRPRSEPALELHSRAASSVRVTSPGSNTEGGQIKNKK